MVECGFEVIEIYRDQNEFYGESPGSRRQKQKEEKRRKNDYRRVREAETPRTQRQRKYS